MAIPITVTSVGRPYYTVTSVDTWALAVVVPVVEV